MAVVMEAYVNGVSTRKVDRLVEQLGNSSMSKDRVSRMCRGLDEHVERRPNGTYLSPYNFQNAVLTDNADGTMKMLFTDSNETWTWDTFTPRFVQSIKRADLTIITPDHSASNRGINYPGGRLSYTLGSYYLAQTITDSASGSQWSYAYGADNVLTTATKPGGAPTTYAYNLSNQITQITNPTGDTRAFTYYANGTVNTATYTPAAASPLVTSFEYGEGPDPCGGAASTWTTATMPDGSRRDYCVDRALYTPDTWDPTPLPAGAWSDLRDRYVNGTENYEVRLGAEDRGAGILLVALQHVGQGTIAQKYSACAGGAKTPLEDPLCPQRVSDSATVNTTALPEGKHDYRLDATDNTNRTTQGAPWSVYVDRTAPSAPDAIVVDDYDDTTTTLSVGVDPGVDPDLSPGLVGSGVDRVEARWRRPGGTWSAWQFLLDLDLDIPSIEPNGTVEVESRELDRVGNVSLSRSATLVGVAPPGSTTVEETPDPSEWPGEETDAGDGPASLRVQVTDETGDRDAGWIVNLDGPNATEISATTDGDGYATFNGLAAGTYRVDSVQLDPSAPPMMQASAAFIVTPSPSQLRTIAIGVKAAIRKLCDETGIPGFGDYCTLNERERNYIDEHPRLGYRFVLDALDATRTSNRLFRIQANEGQDSTRANAFKHSYWVGLMTKRTYQSQYTFGDSSQEGIGGAEWGKRHENELPGTGRSRLAREMDLHNNRVGSDLAKASPRRRKNNGVICAAMLRRSSIGRVEPDGEGGDEGKFPVPRTQLYWIELNMQNTVTKQRTGRYVERADLTC